MQPHADSPPDAELADRLRLIGELTPNVCHELSQPITAIVNFAAACGPLAETAPLSEFLEMIEAEAARAANFIRVWRRFATPGQKADDSCDAGEAVRDALEIMAPEFRRRGIRADMPASTDEVRAAVDHAALMQKILRRAQALLAAHETYSGEKRIFTASCVRHADRVRIDLAVESAAESLEVPAA